MFLMKENFMIMTPQVAGNLYGHNNLRVNIWRQRFTVTISEIKTLTWKPFCLANCTIDQYSHVLLFSNAPQMYSIISTIH